MNDDLIPILEELGRPRVLVLGDVMLDRYITGSVARVSPEAPAMILQADEREVRPGGAASVAALLAALDAEVHVAGVIGDDADGQILRQLLTDAGIESSQLLVDSDRPTTVKERFLARTAGRQVQHLLRVDREATFPLNTALEKRIVESLFAGQPRYDAVVVSDYYKGLVTPELMAAILAFARDRRVPVLVDPARIADYGRYRGVTVLKPNRVQAELATNRRIERPDDAFAAGKELCDRYHLNAAVITLDRDGIVLVPAAGPERWFPTPRCHVRDITGAGDMVLATLALVRGGGKSLTAATRLANVAAGLEVQQLGVAPVTRAAILAALQSSPVTSSKQVTAEQMAALAEGYRHQGKRVVFTNGCFDLLHAGHVCYLQEAAQLGDVLVVAINSDRSVRALKGGGRPIVVEADRVALVAALECVNHVVIFDERAPIALLEKIRPHVLAKGGMYRLDQVVGREAVEAYGGEVHLTNRRPDLSTTHLLHCIRNRSAGPNMLQTLGI